MEREELVRGLTAGDEEAWRQFLDDFGSLMYAVILKLPLSEAEREDVFQDTCVTILRSIHTLRDPSRLASWVSRIAYRQGVESLRRMRRQASLEEADRELQSAAEKGGTPPILQELEHLQEVAQLYDALARLGARCRRLLMALYLEEPRCSYAEISRREEIPMGSIGPTRARCLVRLRQELERISNAESDTSY